MEIKTFRARSMQEALQLVRRTLGPDATLLQTRDVRNGLFGWLPGAQQVEVLASADVPAPCRLPAGVLPPDAQFVLFEGNYLLLRDPPWSDLARYWTLTIWLSAPPATLEARLLERWLAEGLTEAEARSRVEMNDLPNVRFVEDHSRTGDLQFRLGQTALPDLPGTEKREND